MSKTLALGPDLRLPIEVVTQKLGFLGKTGSGKTYASQKLAELMLGIGAQIIALDPVGKWWSLRLAADGVSPGIEIPVFGGLQGDVPLEPTAGKLIADVIADRGISAVIDVSQFESDAEKARFATAFGERLFYRKKGAPTALHIFVEEAQEFIPQNPGRDENLMLHTWTKIQKLGRNFGIGSSIITQRPQEVSKKVLNQTELLLVFQLTGPQERKAVEGWIQEKGLNESIADDLPKLKPGHAHAWSPSWLDISRQVAIGEKWTFDASSTPKVGARSAEVKPLAPVDVAQLGKEIAASAERAKAEDPKALRATIAQLRSDLTKATKGNGHGKGVPVVDENAAQRLVDRALAAAAKERAQGDARRVRIVKQIGGEFTRMASQLSAVVASIEQAKTSLEQLGVEPTPAAVVQALRPDPAAAVRAVAAPAPARVPPRPRDVNVSGVSGPQRKILDTLHSFEAIGIEAVDRVNVAAFVGYHVRAKSFTNNMSALRTAGLLEDAAGSALSLTAAGRAASSPSIDIRDLDALHRAWSERMSGPQRTMLAMVIGAHPRAVSRDELAAACNYHVRAKSFTNGLSRMHSLGLVDYQPGGLVVATRKLFPEGLS